MGVRLLLVRLFIQEERKKDDTDISEIIMTDKKEEAASTEEDARPLPTSMLLSPDEEKRAFLFSHMADMPWPFLVILPIAFILITAFGWTSDDKIEKEVANLWIAEDGDYAADRDYAEAFSENDLGSTSYAALSISRDGTNILTATRLAEVRDRMEAAEATTVRETRATCVCVCVLEERSDILVSRVAILLLV